VSLCCDLQLQRFMALHLIWKSQGCYTAITTVMPRCSHRFGRNRTGKVNSLEYSDIPKAFFTPYHGRWRQQGDQGTKKYKNRIKGNNDILGNSCTNVIRRHCCATKCSDNGSSSTTVAENQTDRHGRALKASFAAARAWRTNKNEKFVPNSFLRKTDMMTTLE
jgi:hypothetical protein